jgi:hypothetical protein
MDTTWFAIDEYGHVAAFDSGEDGHVPERAEDDDLLNQLWRLRHPEADEDAWLAESD